MNDHFTIEPTPKQADFITATSKFQCFSGGFGSGKTYACCLKALLLSTYPNNRGLVGRLCYDDQTEILTEERGWVLFMDLKLSDKVATLHSNNTLVFESPISYYSAPYKGQMVGVRNRSFDFLVTPEHKMWGHPYNGRDPSRKKWRMEQAQNIYKKYKWCMKKNVENYQGQMRDVSIDMFEFIGYWLAEGWVSKKKEEIILTTLNDTEYVEDLLQRTFCNYSKYKKQGSGFNYRMIVTDEVKYWVRILRECGNGALTKRIPGWMKTATKQHLQALIHGFIIGDGHYRKNKNQSTQAWTSSKQLADDIQDIAFRAGYNVTIYNRGIKKRKNSYGGKNEEFEITFLQPAINKVYKDDWYKLNYKGNIYCVQVSTGIIYVRRNGKAAWSSNTYPELRSTTRRSFFEICPPEYYDPARGGLWKQSENYLRLVNNSEIYFIHLDTVSEKELLSLNIGWFFIDQAEEIGERVFQILQSRLRLNTVPNRYGLLACNPEPGNWIYQRFKKPYEDGKPDPNYFLIDSTTDDNPYLPVDYKQVLLESYPESMAKRYVFGRWDAFEGAIYSEFNRDIHVIKPFTPPKGWEYLVSVDHGMVNPTAGYVCGIDYDGNVYVVDEYYSPGVVSAHAKEIIRMSAGFEIDFWLIDPSTRAKNREKDGMPWSVIEEYEDYGLYFTPANNEKLAGINRVREFLKVDPKRINPQTGKHGSPRLFIFQNCVNLIDEFPQYRWKQLRSLTDRNAREEPVDYKDHGLDALRYMIMSRFESPSRKPRNNQMIMPIHRQNMNEMTKELPKNYEGDNLLGQLYGESTYVPLSTDTYEE